MGSFAAVTIFLLLVIIFSIVILVAILISQWRRGINPYNDCNTNKDCLLGYVCISDPVNTQGICRGVSGTFCSSNSQCQPGLQCSFTTGNTGGGTGICMGIPVPPPITAATTLVKEPVRRTINSSRFNNINNVNNVNNVKMGLLTEQIQKENVQSAMVKRPILTSMLQANSSTDNEINSDGCTTDGPFDLRSQCSTVHSRSTSDSSASVQYRGSVSTPCQEHDGVYYCRKNSSVVQMNELGDEISGIEHSAVIDVCSYSSATIYLLNNSNIICENENGRWRATNNIKLQRIVSYDGYIYGVSETRTLYKLSNDNFTHDRWSWTVVDWAPYNIMHICTTLDSKALWIQARETERASVRGFLYSATGVVFHDVGDIKRIYGRDTEHYLDLNPNNNTAVLYPGTTSVNNVYDAGLSYYNEVMSISPSEKQLYRGITIVDWKPYYIRR